MWTGLNVQRLGIVELLLMAAFQISIYSTLLYVLRNFVRMIPFIEIKGVYDPQRLKELDGGIIAGFTLFFFCPNLLSITKEILHRQQ